MELYQWYWCTELSDRTPPQYLSLCVLCRFISVILMSHQGVTFFITFFGFLASSTIFTPHNKVWFHKCFSNHVSLPCLAVKSDSFHQFSCLLMKISASVHFMCFKNLSLAARHFCITFQSPVICLQILCQMDKPHIIPENYMAYDMLI
jgi:hypothetical protein